MQRIVDGGGRLLRPCHQGAAVWLPVGSPRYEAGGRSPGNAFPSSDLVTASPNSLKIQRIADGGGRLQQGLALKV